MVTLRMFWPTRGRRSSRQLHMESGASTGSSPYCSLTPVRWSFCSAFRQGGPQDLRTTCSAALASWLGLGLWCCSKSCFRIQARLVDQRAPEFQTEAKCASVPSLTLDSHAPAIMQAACVTDITVTADDRVRLERTRFLRGTSGHVRLAGERASVIVGPVPAAWIRTR